VVGARCGGVRGFGKSPGYLFGGEGSIILIVREAEEQGRWGLGEKEMMKECLRYLSWVGGPWQLREALW